MGGWQEGSSGVLLGSVEILDLSEPTKWIWGQPMPISSADLVSVAYNDKVNLCYKYVDVESMMSWCTSNFSMDQVCLSEKCIKLSLFVLCSRFTWLEGMEGVPAFSSTTW